MGYLSIRNIPEHLEAKIVKEARRRHTTKTKVVIEALEQALAPAKKKGAASAPVWVNSLKTIPRMPLRNYTASSWA